MTKIAGSGSESGSGSISQGHGSPDPDPPQNVMNLQHYLKGDVSPLEVDFAEGVSVDRSHSVKLVWVYRILISQPPSCLKPKTVLR
jgi:hypothetical protein